MKNRYKYAVGCCILTMLVCSPALGAAAGAYNFSDKSLKVNERSLLTGSELLLAEASEANATTGKGTDSSATSEEKKPTQAEIAEAINNPLSSLWLLLTQNDTKWYSGDALDLLHENDKVMNTTLLQPVMPMQITEDWAPGNGAPVPWRWLSMWGINGFTGSWRST